MKLKLNTASAQPTPAPTPAVQTPGGSGLKISFKHGSLSQAPPSAPAPPSDAAPPPKPKRKYTKKAGKADGEPKPAKPSKKRARKDADDDDGDGDEAEHVTPANKKAKRPSHDGANGFRAVQPPSASVLPTPAPSQPRPSLPKIRIKTSASKPDVGPARIKVKHQGKPPPRPLGVGYDSEAEDVEVDPAIESQFILRMAPGEDCEYLRKAIEEKRVGLPRSEGGADVVFRFFDKEGRRAVVKIRGRDYAATLVDLPCVIEGMKSWDKRGWWKSADICQMLLVLGRVQNEEEAKNFPLPKEVDPYTFQYPHGLTPPMHNVRKRRFRKRVSYRTIEAVEDEVERLLAEDDKVAAAGGGSQYKILDLDRLRDAEEATEDEEDMYETVEGGDADAEGEYYEDEEEDDEAMARLMEQELGGDGDEEAVTSSAVTPQDPVPAVYQAPTTAVINGATGADAIVLAATPSASADQTEEESEEDDDADDAIDEMDEDAKAAQDEMDQQREEIAELEKEVDAARARYENMKNPMIKQKLAENLMSLQQDLELKRGSMGAEWDE